MGRMGFRGTGREFLKGPLPNEIGGKTPKSAEGSHGSDRRRDNMMMTASRVRQNPTACVYCGASEHYSKDCTQILATASRREFSRKHSSAITVQGLFIWRRSVDHEAVGGVGPDITLHCATNHSQPHCRHMGLMQQS